MKRKKKKKKNSSKTCPYCKGTYTQKYNRDRHIKNMHQEDAVAFVENVEEVMEITDESQENNNKEIMNNNEICRGHRHRFWR